MNQAVAVVVAYLLGSIPFSYLAGRAKGIDLRRVGSGNLGAANAFRALGRGAGIAVLVADIGKGVLAVVIARAITDDPWPAIAAGAAMAGHVFPVWLRFKGGKGVAVGGGAIIALMPLASVILLGLWLVVAVVSRYTSLGQHHRRRRGDARWCGRWGTRPRTSSSPRSRPLAVLVLHRGNIVRLLGGRENRIELKRGAARREPGTPA